MTLPDPEARIFFYLPSFAGGGAERVMVRLVSHLADTGHSAALVVNTATGPLRPLLSPSVRLHVLGTPRAYAALPRLVALLRATRPAWMVSAMTRTNLVALAAARLAGGTTRVIACERNHFGQYWGGKGRVGRGLVHAGVRALYPSAAAVIGNAPGVAAEITRAAGLKDGGAAVICNPAPDAAEIAAARAAPCPHPWLAADRDRPVLVAMGRLMPQKDYPVMLGALARSRTGARLLVLGDGPERAALEALAADLGLSDRVAFLGWRDNRFDYLVRADGYVLSSITEGFPNALVEAVACGVPAISTDCAGGGAREILHPQLADNIVPVGDTDALAAAIDRNIDTAPAQSEIVGIAARYRIDTIADAFLHRMSA